MSQVTRCLPPSDLVETTVAEQSQFDTILKNQFAKEELTLSETKKMPNKSQFIRSQPASVVASEVVKKAKDAGMSISAQMVYAIRSAARKSCRT